MKIAIIGSGIAGLGAAYLLDKNHDIKLFEKNNYIGGHSNTTEISYNGKKIAVDTGFIVYNEPNYPCLAALFEELNVKTEKSNMSFSVSIDDGRLEYAGTNLGTVFAQYANILKLRFIKMLLNILRFNRRAAEILKSDEDISLGQYLDKLKMGDYFRRYYLLPMGGAIWSCPVAQMLEFPAQTFIRFFQNHGLLTVAEQPEWRTVSGGSREYVKKITANFADKIALSTPIACITRQEGKVVVEDIRGNQEIFDHVVIASHGDQALAMLKNPLPEEKKALANFKYQKNTAILHRDSSLMPRRRKAWSSWNYQGRKMNMEEPRVSLTYWMNLLQNIDNNYPLFVTMNPLQEIAAEKIFAEFEYEHPVFDSGTIAAQKNLAAIQGNGNIWFAGSYFRYGFHEDALMSAVNVANLLGAKAGWQG